MSAALMNFGDAIAALQAGQRVQRLGWNGKNMYLALVPGQTFRVGEGYWSKFYSPDTLLTYHAHVDMMTAQGYIVPWLASQTDIQATDWTLYTPEALDKRSG
jgi:hypothetical protein